MKKSKKPELKTVDDELEEEVPVERLKVNKYGADDEDTILSDDIDNLLREERLVDDDALDKLFSDTKKSKYDDVEVEVRKALYQSKTSNAQLSRANKSAEVTKKTRSEEIAKYKTLEDDWDGVLVEEAKAGRPLMYVALVFLALVIGAGVWALWNVSKSDEVAHKEIHDQRRQDQEELAQKRADAGKEIKKIETVLMQFSKAEKAEDKLEFIHNSENLREAILAYYENSQIAKSYINLNIERVVEELVHKRRVWTAIGSYGHRDTENHEFFFFHREDDGSYKLDWQAIAGTQDDDWKTFVHEQSTEPIEIRVIVEPKIEDGHYNWGFDDDEYSAYKLTLNDEQVFWGYVKNDNLDLVKKMNSTVITMRAYQKVYKTLKLEMILKVKFHKDTHELNKQCVEITEIVSPHWLDLRGKAEGIEVKENQ